MQFTHIAYQNWRSGCIHLLLILLSNFIDSSASLSVHYNVIAFTVASQFSCLLIWCECDVTRFNELQECSWYMVLLCLLTVHKWWCKHLKRTNIPSILLIKTNIIGQTPVFKSFIFVYLQCCLFTRRVNSLQRLF